MGKLLIKNGNVVLDSQVVTCDILINGGMIEEIGENISQNCQIIDAANLHIMPGFIDMHTHVREPGFEYKEDIQSASKAAVAGGFTQICAMPNTNPVCDNAQVAEYIVNRSKQIGLSKVHPIGSISQAQKGNKLAEIGKMKQAGIVAISDDGLPVVDSALMRHAIEYASGFGLKVLSHCEDKWLSANGQINEGFVSTVTGLKGINRASEEIMVAREIILAQALNLPVHICHISTAGSVALVRQAKSQGVLITCETCPHYFSLTDQAALSMSPMVKVNPPLREEADRQAIIDALIDGTIDAIATDHAPHHLDEKNCEFELAAFGISGLETAFSLAVTHLIKTGKISIVQLAKLLSHNPAKILNLSGGSIAVGKEADLTIVNLNQSVTVSSVNFASKGKNTPFENYMLTGKVKYTIIDGQIKFGE